MEWWLIIAITLFLLLSFFASGLPVAFAFLLFNVIAVIFWMGGVSSLLLVASSMFSNIGTFVYVAIPMFILMGEILFQTGLASLMISNMAKWIGHIRGSLSVLAIASGSIFAMMSGSAISGVALLGSTLVPEMRNRGYSKQMSMGPILGAGSLAVLIPPSIFTIVLAAVARISVGALLIATIVPGLLLGGLFVAYVLIRAQLQPHLAPKFAPPQVTWGERFRSLLIIFPISFIIFLVLGLIFLGVATPSEASAIGAVGAFLLAVTFRKLTWEALNKSISGTLMITGMVFMVLVSSETFSQILAFTGATGRLVGAVSDLSVSPIVVIIFMQLMLLMLGCFIDAISIMLITVPIYFPVIIALGFDPIWFGCIMVVNLELGTLTPPFGMALFTIKGVVEDASTIDVWRAATPFALLGLTLIVILLLVPELATWLPGLMR